MTPEQTVVRALRCTCRRLHTAIDSRRERDAEKERKVLVENMADVLTEFGLTDLAERFRKVADKEFLRPEDMDELEREEMESEDAQM